MTKLALSLSTLLIALSAVNAKSMTYVQNNGSLDGYYEQDGDSNVDSTTGITSTPEKATESATATSQTSDEVSTTDYTTNHSLVTDSYESTASGKTTAEEEQSSEAYSATDSESKSTTVWWTPESTHVSTGSDTQETAHPQSTTEWWTPESKLTSTPSMTSKPAPTGSAGSLDSTTISDSNNTCETEWGQCGGAGYSGVSCCQNGYTCVAVNSNWARCIAASTLNYSSSKATTTSSTKNAKVETYVSDSTIYSTSETIYETTIKTTNSAGSTYETVLASTSISVEEKAVSSVTEESTNGVSDGKIIPSTALFVLLASLLL